MAKKVADGFYKENTIVIKHEGKTYRVFKGEAEIIKRGLLKRSTVAAKLADAKEAAAKAKAKA